MFISALEMWTLFACCYFSVTLLGWYLKVFLQSFGFVLFAIFVLFMFMLCCYSCAGSQIVEFLCLLSSDGFFMLVMKKP